MSEFTQIILLQTIDEVLDMMKQGWILYTNGNSPQLHAQRRSIRQTLHIWMKHSNPLIDNSTLKKAYKVDKKIFTKMKKKLIVPIEDKGAPFWRIKYVLNNQ